MGDENRCRPGQSEERCWCIMRLPASFEANRQCQPAQIHFLHNWNPVTVPAIEYQLQRHAWTPCIQGVVPLLQDRPRVLYRKGPWPKQRHLLRHLLPCHRYHQLWEGVTLVLEAPRLDMTRNERSQPQELALEGEVIGYDFFTDLKHGLTAAVDSVYQPILRRLITYLRAKFKSRSSTIHHPPHEQSEGNQRLVERSTKSHPVPIQGRQWLRCKQSTIIRMVTQDLQPS